LAFEVGTRASQGEQRRLLEAELRSSLDGDLGRLARNAGLDRERLTRRAIEQAPELLEATVNSWPSLVEARQKERQHRQSRSWPRILLKPRAWLIPLAAMGVSVVPLGILGAVYPEEAPAAAVWAALALIAVCCVPVVRVTYRSMRRSEEPAVRLLAEGVSAAMRLHRRALQGSVRAWITQEVNAVSERSYETKLSYTDSSGLAEVDDSAREIPTGARDRLLRLMESMPGGAIGLSGSRGAGKTTLMRSLCRSEKNGSDAPVVATMVDAPVSYDARDFVLHLFAQTCSEVLGPGRVARLRGWGRPAGIAPGPMLALLSGPQALFGLMCSAAGLGLIAVSVLDLATSLSSPWIWGVVLLVAGYLLTGGSVVAETLKRRRAPGASARPVSTDAPEDHDVQTAAVRLRQIWFQQSFTTGWSGSLKAPIGLEGGISGSTELAEQQLSFPEIVSLFKDFLEQVASSRQIRIGIDELDKMDDETARRFLNEIKVVFRVPGCFFLVSISEDAMSFFERRGLPFRDVFDSSFDDVVHIPNLQFDLSRKLLDRRIVDLPLPFACLLHGISGGLPRDLIRSARDLVEMKEGTALEPAAAELMRDSLRSKAVAARVAARRFHSEDHASLLIGWLERLEEMDDDPAELLSACGDFERAFLGRLVEIPELDELPRERLEVQSLGTQLVAFAYHAATMWQFLSRFDEADYVDRAIAADGDAGETSLVDRLAEVTQAFTADLNTVWEALSRLRTDLGLAMIPFPKLHLRDPAPKSMPMRATGPVPE
jgi:hypothetical protein